MLDGAMGEKTPDSGQSGIERRDILKGLGFGAMGLAGVGAMSGGAAATSHVNVGFTPPDEDLEDDEINGAPPTLDPSATDSTYDLVIKAPMGAPDSKHLVGKSWTVVTKGPERMQVTKEVFEEGTVDASTEEVMADTDGMMEIRQNFSVEDLSGDHILVLSAVNYSELMESGMQEDEGINQGVYNFDPCNNENPGSGMTIAHGFTVP